MSRSISLSPSLSRMISRSLSPSPILSPFSSQRASPLLSSSFSSSSSSSSSSFSLPPPLVSSSSSSRRFSSSSSSSAAFSSATASQPIVLTKKTKSFTATQMKQGQATTYTRQLNSMMHQTSTSAEAELPHWFHQEKKEDKYNWIRIQSYYSLLNLPALSSFFRSSSSSSSLLPLLSTASLCSSAIDTVTIDCVACLPSLYRLIASLQQMILELYREKGEKRNMLEEMTKLAGVKVAPGTGLQTESLSEVDSWLHLTCTRLSPAWEGLLKQRELKSALDLLTSAYINQDVRMSRNELESLFNVLDPYIQRCVKAIYAATGIKN